MDHTRHPCICQLMGLRTVENTCVHGLAVPLVLILQGVLLAVASRGPRLSRNRCHRPGGLGSFLTVPGPGWSGVKVPTTWSLVRALFLASGRPSPRRAGSSCPPLVPSSPALSQEQSLWGSGLNTAVWGAVQSTGEACSTDWGSLGRAAGVLGDPWSWTQSLGSGPGSERRHLFVLRPLRCQVAGSGPPVPLWGSAGPESACCARPPGAPCTRLRVPGAAWLGAAGMVQCPGHGSGE